jgi:hypothetical protein
MRLRLRQRSIVFVAVVAFLTPAALAATAPKDPPRIVPWKKIGNVGLGMTRAAVEARYGPTKGVSSLYFVDGGRLGVSYDDGRVSSIATDSKRYRTPTGIHVGMKVPLGVCHRVNNTCEYTWRGFTLDGRVGWRRVSHLDCKRDSIATLFLRKGTITLISLEVVPRRIGC